MATEASTPIKAGPTTAKIAYQHEDQKDVIVMVGTIGGARYPTTLNKVDVEIKDLREVPDFKPTLDKNGFSVISGQKPLPRELKEGDQKVVDDVYAQITETLKRETGCTDVHIFSHIVRDDPFQRILDVPADADPMTKWPHKTTAQFGHVDQSYSGAGSTFQNTLGRLPADRAETLRKLEKTQRWAIINTWRPISTVHREPLAVADGSSVPDADLRIMEVDPSILVGGPAPHSELWQAVHRPGHKWWYASNMTKEEGLLIKCFDTRMESGADATCRRALHSAFIHPEDNGPPRQSCEFRAFCFWADEERKGDEVEHAYDNSFRVPVAAA